MSVQVATGAAVIAPSFADGPRWIRWATTLLSWFAMVLLALFVLGLVMVALAPRVLGAPLVIVIGGSMEPTIPLGSVAIMRAIEAKDVREGDIIKYIDPRYARIVTHRVIGIDQRGHFITRGDANPAPDLRTVAPQHVQAKYLFSVPRVGYFIQWIGTRQGFLSIILVPGIAIIGLELLSIARALWPGRTRRSLEGDGGDDVEAGPFPVDPWASERDWKPEAAASETYEIIGQPAVDVLPRPLEASLQPEALHPPDTAETLQVSTASPGVRPAGAGTTAGFSLPPVLALVATAVSLGFVIWVLTGRRTGA
jgi:signal peptidase I